MEITNLSEIKSHLRIESDIEDSLLESYGDAAEAMVIRYLRRSVSELCASFGGGQVPADIRLAVLLLVGHFVKNREASSTQQVISLPFGVSSLLSPFVRLSLTEEEK